jgi:hypothetical protein
MSANPLVAQVLSGESFELQVLAAQGILPLSAEELIPLQVRLASSGNEMVADYARTALAQVEPHLAANFLANEADAEALEFFAGSHDDPLILETILRRRDTPRELLAALGTRLPADLQEILLLRQDAIVERPEILVALESNPQLSIYSRRRILEYREHLLPRARPQAEVRAPAALADAELDAEDLAELERVQALPHEGELDEHTGLSEGQVRALSVPLRMKLTRGASRTLRGILLRDSNAMVAVSVLANSAMSEDEVEQVASSRTVVDDVLAYIARRREWVSRYNIAHNLVRNPRAPVGLSVRLVSRLSVRDLKSLSRDRNVSDAVRSTAERVYRIKRE